MTSSAFTPRGGRFDPRALLRNPVRALRGGDDGIAVSFAVDLGAVTITVLARGEFRDEDIDAAFAAARGIAGLDDDPSEFRKEHAAHPVLGPLLRNFDCRMTRTPTVFESFAEAVIAQLVTSQEASDARWRLWREAGELVSGTNFRAAPTAAAVRRVPSWKMLPMGIGVRRANTLRDGASRGATLERIGREHEPAVFIEKIMSMPGVGPWTANRVARSALGYADAVPVGDLHAPSVVTQALLGEARFKDDLAMLEVLAAYRPHRARVMMLLERAHLAPSPFGGTGRRRIARPHVDRHRREPWKY